MDQRIIFPLVTRVANQNLPRASRIHLRQMLVVMLQAYFPYYPVAQWRIQRKRPTIWGVSSSKPLLLSCRNMKNQQTDKSGNHKQLRRRNSPACAYKNCVTVSAVNCLLESSPIGLTPNSNLCGKLTYSVTGHYPTCLDFCLHFPTWIINRYG